MSKRDLPPPSPAAVLTSSPVRDSKKFRDYASPARQPSPSPVDRNVTLRRNRGGTPLKSHVSLEELLVKPVAEKPQGKRAVVLQKRKSAKAAILNPATRASPKAALPSASTRQAIVGGTPLKALRTNSLLSSTELVPAAASNLSVVSNLSVSEMSRNFEEWIKAASDNKINAKNTWSVALIDYFHELTFLRDEKGDGVNFQKASCTLDGCVKIYSSRVDSVVDATTKLLNGLGARLDESQQQDDAGLAAEDESTIAKAKKKSVRQAETLEKSFETLNLKLLEDRHPVAVLDPSFRQQMELEEGSSRGLLLYSLPLRADGMTMAMDPTACAFFEEGPAEEEAAPWGEPVDIAPFLGDLTRPVTNAFAEFVADAPVAAIQLPAAAQEAPNPFIQDDDAERAHAFDDCNDFEAGAFDHVDSDDEAPQQGAFRAVEQTQLFARFDAQMDASAWAGPEHWKIRRHAAFAPLVHQQPRPARTKRAIVVLDFAAASAAADAASLFAKPASAASITLSQQAIMERAENAHCLPDDFHFSSANLLGLFCKPSWRRQILRPSGSRASDAAANAAHVGESFWAEQQPHEHGLAAAGTEDGHTDADFGAAFTVDEPPTQPLPFAGTATGGASELPFAGQAKRVDIHRLKEMMYDRIVSAEDGHGETFSSILSYLRSRPDAELAMQDVTVPYCFIGLLHLANEHDLVLRGDGLQGDLQVVPMP